MIKTEGIILAAGQSKRFGSNKLIFEIDGMTIIERCIISMYDSCSKIIVVAGDKARDIYDIVKKYPNIYLAYNPSYLDGMYSSIKAGIKFVEGDRFFLTPGDYPFISTNTYKSMLKIHKDIVVPVYKNQKGHPILINSSLIDEIVKDNKHNSLREFILAKDFYTTKVDDPNILYDIDTRDEL